MTTELHEAGPRLKSDSDFWRDPYLFYDKLRSVHPVYKGTVLKHLGWYVTGYEEAAAILRDAVFKTAFLSLKPLQNMNNFTNCSGI